MLSLTRIRSARLQNGGDDAHVMQISMLSFDHVIYFKIGFYFFSSSSLIGCQYLILENLYNEVHVKGVANLCSYTTLVVKSQ